MSQQSLELDDTREIEVPHGDPHVHGRMGEIKKHLLSEASRRMSWGALEPNTSPHLLQTYDDVARYVEDAAESAPGCAWAGSIYMTEHTDHREVLKAWKAGVLSHVKIYPPHGSTHTADAPAFEMLLNVNSTPGKTLSMMAEAGIPCKRHGEIPVWKGEPVDPPEREGLYYREHAGRFRDTYRGLRIINAHLTTAEGVRHMKESGDPYSYVCEVTGHHLACAHAAMYDGGSFLPYMHCLPTLKDKYNWRVVRMFFAQGHPYVMAASDMAYHPFGNKFAFCCLGGIGTYHCSLELYVQMLDELGALEHAHKLLWGNAKNFFGTLMPEEPRRFRLVRRPWKVEKIFDWAGQQHAPFGWHPDPQKRFEFQFQLA